MFWWDNLDKNLDRACGGGSLHITPGIAFQEEVTGSEFRNMNVNQKRSKRRSLKLPEPSNRAALKIDPKKNPQRFTTIRHTAEPTQKLMIAF